MRPKCLTIQMKAILAHFYVVRIGLFSVNYCSLEILEAGLVIPTFKSVDETLVCDHSNKSYRAVLSCGTVCHAVQGGSYFFDLRIKSLCVTKPCVYCPVLCTGPQK